MADEVAVLQFRDLLTSTGNPLAAVFRGRAKEHTLTPTPARHLPKPWAVAQLGEDRAKGVLGTHPSPSAVPVCRVLIILPVLLLPHKAHPHEHAQADTSTTHQRGRGGSPVQADPHGRTQADTQQVVAQNVAEEDVQGDGQLVQGLQGQREGGGECGR